MKKLVVMTVLIFVSAAARGSDSDLQSQIETLKTQVQALQNDRTPAQSIKGASDTMIGGYGEIHYNHYSQEPSRSQADLNRFVLFFGHRFNEQIGFFSEVEWEHAIVSKTDDGETEIEQAYIDYNIGPDFKLKVGLFLIPLGLLNQNHEPPVFHSVERNEVETRIIPSTWREGGIGLSGTTDVGLSWDLGVTTGFDIAKFEDAGAPLSGMHQELQNAKASDPAFYMALNYRGVPGLLAGAAVFTGGTTQGNASNKADSSLPDLGSTGARLTLWDLHTRFQRHGFDVQAVYAQGTISGADQINEALAAYNIANSATTGFTDRVFVPTQFYGWLTEVAYTVWSKDDQSLAPFIRFEQFNTQSKMSAGLSGDSANADRVVTAGLSFHPHPSVVFKADYQEYADNSRGDRFNLGMGYMF